MTPHADPTRRSTVPALLHSPDLDRQARLRVLAWTLADRYAVADIETEGVPMELDGATWYDLRPMIDLREHPPEQVDMAAQAIDYALERVLIERHPQHAHLVRVTPRGRRT